MFSIKTNSGKLAAGITSIFLVLFLMPTGIFSQPAPLGLREKIDINSLKAGDYTPGIIYLKLKAGYERNVEEILNSANTSSIETGLENIDAVSKKYQAKKISPSFERILKDTRQNFNHNSWALNRWITIELAADADIVAAIKSYQALTGLVEVAEPSFRRELHDNNQPVVLWTPNDSAFGSQWHFNNTFQQGPTNPPGVDADINLPEAWSIQRGRPEVIVAVLDGGVDTSHPDLRANLWIGNDGTRFGINWNNQAISIQPNSHGTHVSGTIAAVNNNTIGVSGIAGGDGTAGSGARIMSMQIFSPDGTYAGDAAAANAFVYAADHGAAVAQNSWGGANPSTILTDAIDYFIMNGGGNVLNGGIVVFSAGNNGNNTPVFPNSYPPVICVSATDYSDKIASYSNYGSFVDICAPGGDGTGFKQVLSTLPNNTYGWLHGTSMAAPHVSGVAALCISNAEGILSNEQVRNIILNNADDIYPLNPSYTGMLGSGRLDAYKALQATALAIAPTVNPVTGFTATQNCGLVNLSWTKNAQNNSVIVAQSDTLLFGTPSGTLNVGDTITGGGKIIYNGSGSNFSTPIPANKKRYYQIWSYSGSQYSFHETTSAIYNQAIYPLTATNTDSCTVNFTISDNLGCINDSVLIVAGSRPVFTVPSGIINVGYKFSTGEKVIYKGRSASASYTADLDSIIYFKKWNFNTGHEYVNTDSSYTSVIKTNAIVTFAANVASNSQINLSWSKSLNSCFNGTNFLLACSTVSIFGYPTGNYNAGDSIAGGGTVLYNGSNTGFSHTGLSDTTIYYYRLWEIRTGPEYSFGKSTRAKTFCSNSTLTLPFSDGFEGSDLSNPQGCFWTVENNTGQPDALKIVTTGGLSPDIPPIQGTSMLRFYSYVLNAGQQVRLTSSFVKKGIGTAMDIRFRWYQDSSAYVDASYAGEGVLVQWSNNNTNWKNLEYYPRVPVEGDTGWSYKQLSLPDASLAYDTVYISFLFTSGYGNNCYMDDMKFQSSSYKPADNTTAYASSEFTDSTNLWTHLYDTLGNRLISIKKNGNDIGKAGQSSYIMKLGPTGATKIAFNNNYVSNPGGWISMNRYYSIKPVTEPTSKLNIRYYYFTADFTALSNAATTLNPSRSNISQTDLYAWKINDIINSYDVNPANGHIGVPNATIYSSDGFTQYVTAPNADTTTWQYSSLGNNLHRMEYTVSHLGGGTLGIGSVSGKGALQIVTYTFNGNGNWSQTSNWLNGNKPPAILPNNGLIIIDPVISGECVLDVQQTVPAGASIQVNAGKKFRIQSNLQVKQ